ncbi:probable low-specificity L-threonine aldolase 1 [Anneissia japonica]|uniref:probable low-specificity L-threonine aldolase 1 n=1 Tax=Anneissia japonica TaxID=1529436 RepID=UPI001425B23C|nr:probable low-specificity L-threonine aldolase 1 [Anneissia japonica]
MKQMVLVYPSLNLKKIFFLVYNQQGLGAPVGSIIAGSKAFIDKSLRHRKVLGGGMRQGGILAAAALLALDRATDKIKLDHENAKRFAEGRSWLQANMTQIITVG